MNSLPYYTTDDGTQWAGHVWRQRACIDGPWGYSWEVLPPDSEEAIAWGWTTTQATAESDMQAALERHSNPTEGQKT